jgi:hypothetical protein
VPETAARVFRALGSLKLDTRPLSGSTPDPAFLAADQQRRDALLHAVAAERPDWSEQQRRTLAAVLDVLWGVPSYERLVDQWDLEPEAAMAVLTWAIGAVVAAPAPAPASGGDDTP